MPVTNSPNMNLPVPVVGSEAGPQYAIDINACLAQIDAHDHTTGNGVVITPSALNINSDLPFNSNNATLLRSARFISQGSPISGTADLNCLSVSGVDLYYRDGNGNSVRVTQSGGIAGSPGSIANLTSPASASYVAIDETFVWESDANTAASMDFASAILRNSTASSFGLTLQPPTLSSDYTLTLPTVPLATSFLTISASGVMGPTIPIAQGITTSMIADQNVTTAKIADANVTLVKMATDSVNTPQIINEAVTPAKLSAFNYVTSGSSGSFTTTSSSQVDIQQTPSFTASGIRPVLVTISPVSPTLAGYFGVIDATNPAAGFIYISRRVAGVDTDIAKTEISTNTISSTLIVPGSLSFIDFPAAGALTYKIKGNVTSSPTTVLSAFNVQITALEL